MRHDLPTGFAAAQVAHAAGESVAGPVPHGTVVVLLSAPNECALRDLSSRVTLPHRLIIESDAPYSGQATAIGFAPTTDRASIAKLLSNLPLYMGQRQRKVLVPKLTAFNCRLTRHTPI